MKIKQIGIKGFRGYSDLIQIPVSELLVLVGRNDIGKSTVLEALDIFFNEGRGCVKLDKEDINKSNLATNDDSIEIFVEFDDLPDSIVIDTANKTTLKAEYLLTEAGTLKVVKRYQNAGKEKIFITAYHPTALSCSELHLKKNAELKRILEEQQLNCNDRTVNAELRRAIWSGNKNLELKEIDIEVAKIDTKNIWEQLKNYMPLYTLFQADRKNSDEDSEVQDPMRLAVREILGDPLIQESLTKVAESVKNRLGEVAFQTLEKLKELNPEIASTLNPQLTDVTSLKWIDVFKNVGIAGDNDIPINKRGSGVKRLVLISFFLAEAERRKRDSQLRSVVYAIEEPETSQHPEHQRALINALIQLSKAANTQILMTTHSPEVVKKLNFDNLLLIAGPNANDIKKVKASELPYPSLNEVNFSAFNEPSFEYHNELYGYIQAERKLAEFKEKQELKKSYIKLNNDGTEKPAEMVTLTEYIRHQIHHPENEKNEKFNQSELQVSIEQMREFIQRN